MPKRKQPSGAPKAKHHRSSQLELDDMKQDVLKILPIDGGLTLNQIVAHPLIAEHAVRIYGIVNRKAFTVIKNFLLCGLDSRFTVANGKYVSNPGGVDGRKSITKHTPVQVHCIETGQTCIVTNAQFLAELMYGRKGRSGSHAALMQNCGKRDVYKGYTWNAVPAGNSMLSAEAAHAFFTSSDGDEAGELDIEPELMAGDEAGNYEPDTESEVMAGDEAGEDADSDSCIEIEDTD